ncbi:MAG TPA: transposase [Phycisphaerae bacterium]|nr:transposase [Planctomycetota bacterium]HET6442189.1 transposase [Phycisphaerae bacterium]
MTENFPFPLAYLITFTCYGTWLHGDARGSADRVHRIPGTPYLPPDPVRQAKAVGVMQGDPYALNPAKRCCVLRFLHETCAARGWRLLAAHVRETHVHVVVAAAETPERVMTSLKAYASRGLNEAGFDAPGRKRWTRHGSTRYLWHETAVEQAVAYVVNQQGEAMAVYDARGV